MRLARFWGFALPNQLFNDEVSKLLGFSSCDDCDANCDEVGRVFQIFFSPANIVMRRARFLVFLSPANHIVLKWVGFLSFPIPSQSYSDEIGKVSGFSYPSQLFCDERDKVPGFSYPQPIKLWWVGQGYCMQAVLTECNTPLLYLDRDSAQDCRSVSTTIAMQVYDNNM